LVTKRKRAVSLTELFAGRGNKRNKRKGKREGAGNREVER
jgi:hypothetical protein